MIPFKLRDVFKLLFAAVLAAVLFGAWLTMPALEYVSGNQWRSFAFAVMALLGVLWSLARWNLSALAVGSFLGLLVAGTKIELRLSHGRISDAIKSNLELFGVDIIAFTLAAVLGGYCVSQLKKE